MSILKNPTKYFGDMSDDEYFNLLDEFGIKYERPYVDDRVLTDSEYSKIAKAYEEGM